MQRAFAGRADPVIGVSAARLDRTVRWQSQATLLAARCPPAEDPATRRVGGCPLGIGHCPRRDVTSRVLDNVDVVPGVLLPDPGPCGTDPPPAGPSRCRLGQQVSDGLAVGEGGHADGATARSDREVGRRQRYRHPAEPYDHAIRGQEIRVRRQQRSGANVAGRHLRKLRGPDCPCEQAYCGTGSEQGAERPGRPATGHVLQRRPAQVRGAAGEALEQEREQRALCWRPRQLRRRHRVFLLRAHQLRAGGRAERAQRTRLDEAVQGHRPERTRPGLPEVAQAPGRLPSRDGTLMTGATPDQEQYNRPGSMISVCAISSGSTNVPAADHRFGNDVHERRS